MRIAFSIKNRVCSCERIEDCECLEGWIELIALDEECKSRGLGLILKSPVEECQRLRLRHIDLAIFDVSLSLNSKSNCTRVMLAVKSQSPQEDEADA